ncbi:hypothetical protein KAI92_01040 [Candidatus Parcubacteria bacterium]|nr:hypothetical protein [Candidatus Parcubacteria bacterium]
MNKKEIAVLSITLSLVLILLLMIVFAFINYTKKTSSTNIENDKIKIATSSEEKDGKIRIEDELWEKENESRFKKISEQKKDWLLYSNLIYGYSFKYPKDIKIDVLYPLFSTSTTANLNLYFDDKDFAYISVYNEDDFIFNNCGSKNLDEIIKINRLSLEDYARYHWKLNNHSNNISPLEKIEVDGKHLFLFSLNDKLRNLSFYGKKLFIFMDINSMKYTFEMMDNAISREILKSLKFFKTKHVPQKTVLEIKEWSIFSSKKYGFNIKYPKGWFVESPIHEESRSSNSALNLILGTSYISKKVLGDWTISIYTINDSLENVLQNKNYRAGWDIKSILEIPVKDYIVKKVTFVNGADKVYIKSMKDDYTIIIDGACNASHIINKMVQSIEFISNNIDNWKIFKEQDVNFTFEYPEKWSYSIKKQELGHKHITFRSEIRENEMMIHIPMPAVGLEPFGSIEKKIYQTNDINTDLLLTYMKSADETYKKNMIILQWQTGINGSKLKDEFKEWDNSIMNLISIIGYDEEYDKYYRSIIEKIASSIKFISQ